MCNTMDAGVIGLAAWAAECTRSLTVSIHVVYQRLCRGGYHVAHSIIVARLLTIADVRVFLMMRFITEIVIVTSLALRLRRKTLRGPVMMKFTTEIVPVLC